MLPLIKSYKLIKQLLQKYEDKSPEIVFHWNDPETEAEGWTVINSLRGGAAGGGGCGAAGRHGGAVRGAHARGRVRLGQGGRPLKSCDGARVLARGLAEVQSGAQRPRPASRYRNNHKRL